MSIFWNTASAVPRYHSNSDTRWLAGRMSNVSLRSGRMKVQPRVRCRIRLCALYCVATPMRRIPEFNAFDSAKSMMRVLPPTSACLTCMPGSWMNLTSGPHWSLALKTGLVTGALVLLLSFTPAIALFRQRYANAAVVGCLTALGDAYSHVDHYGTAGLE